MKKLYTVAILGATGAVGQEMMKVLEERDFPVGKLIPLASERSAGSAQNGYSVLFHVSYLQIGWITQGVSLWDG